MNVRFVSFMCCAAALLSLSTLFAAPGSFGFGYPYLLTLERQSNQASLIAYDAPVRVTSGKWLSRFIDADTDWSAVPPGGICAGNFWPAGTADIVGKEYLAAVREEGTNLFIDVYDAPECYSSRPWQRLSRSFAGCVSPTSDFGHIFLATAGDIRGLGAAQLVLLRSLSHQYDADPRAELVILTPSAAPEISGWSVQSRIPFSTGATGTVTRAVALAAGDFWHENKSYLGVFRQTGAGASLQVYSFINGVTGELVYTDQRLFPGLVHGGASAANYVKGGPYESLGDVITVFSHSNVLTRCATLRLPPRSSGGASTIEAACCLNGLSVVSNAISAVASGRIYGYITRDFDFSSGPRQNQNISGFDLEIAWLERTPRYRRHRWLGQYQDFSGDPHFGWPLPGQAITNTVFIKNTGALASPTNSYRLRMWVNRNQRNADTHPATMNSPDIDVVIPAAISPYDPVTTAYYTYAAAAVWPYSFKNTPDEPYKGLDLDAGGEYWTIARIDNPADAIERNNRVEYAVHSWLLHPIYGDNSLTDNRPNVPGDPFSVDYLARKLADMLQTVWERSGTLDGQDVRIRIAAEGFGIRSRMSPADKEDSWEFWSGPRDLDGWAGHGIWQRFPSYTDSSEQHETMHLFHQLGDLYQYVITPARTAAAKFSNGDPVQLRTWCWGPDVFTSQGAKAQFNDGTATVHKHIEGKRNAGHVQWHNSSPRSVNIRVLDRDGLPLSGANVSTWQSDNSTPRHVGITGTNGIADSGIPFGSEWQEQYYHEARFNDTWPAYFDGMGHIITLDKNGYEDAWVLGCTSGAFAHSRFALLVWSHSNPDQFTWTVPTLYKEGAPPFSSDVDAAVRGTEVTFRLASQAETVYRLYRRAEPAYLFTNILTVTGTGGELTRTIDLSFSDAITSGRNRGIFYWTEDNGTESLPRKFIVHRISSANGISYDPRFNDLLVAQKPELDLILSRFKGTVPYWEYGYHFRFGHTLIKAVPSLANQRKQYATMLQCDTPWLGNNPHFEIIDSFAWPEAASKGSYAQPRWELARGSAASFTASSPWQLTDPGKNFSALGINPGDLVSGDGGNYRVTQVSGSTLLYNGPALSAANGYTVYHNAGEAGSGTTNRNLRSPRGLDVITAGSKEYVVIADYGNRRIVVWDDQSAYSASWTTNNFRPTGIARHPLNPDRFFVLSRSTESALYLLEFNGSTVTPVPGWPKPVDCSSTTPDNYSESGLAAATRDSILYLAATDAYRKQITEYVVSGSNIISTTTYSTALQAAGTSQLSLPTDCAYVPGTNRPVLFALDNHERVVRITDDIPEPALLSSLLVSLALRLQCCKSAGAGH